jgi:hypothetical protein
MEAVGFAFLEAFQEATWCSFTTEGLHLNFTHLINMWNLRIPKFLFDIFFTSDQQ